MKTIRIITGISSALLTGSLLAEEKPHSNTLRYLKHPPATENDTKIIEQRLKHHELSQLQKQLADLEVATEKRRVELMRQLALAQSGLLKQPSTEATLPNNPVDTFILKRLKEQGISEKDPKWAIGVVLSGKGVGQLKIKKILEDQPAAKAGLQQNDILLSCNEIQLHDSDSLVNIIQAAKGQPLTLKINRGDKASAKITAKSITIKAIKKKPQESATQSNYRRSLYSPYRDFAVEQLAGDFFDQKRYATAIPSSQKGSLEQLHQDNKELKELLKELIKEVRKLRK